MKELMRTILLGCVVLLWLPAITQAQKSAPLPRFTEEREAAAHCFVKKHLPDLLPILNQLKKNLPAQYQQEIREIFQASELLADLLDDPKRYELELKIWKSSNRANVILARLVSVHNEQERKPLLAQLHELARELVALDIQVMELQIEQLSTELTDLKDDLKRTRTEADQQAKLRYAAWIARLPRPKK